MVSKQFSQDEVNRIIAVRMRRERERLAKETEERFRRCMSSIHLMLFQEMNAMKRDLINEGGGEHDAKYSSEMLD